MLRLWLWGCALADVHHCVTAARALDVAASRTAPHVVGQASRWAVGRDGAGFRTSGIAVADVGAVDISNERIAR